MPIWNVHTDMTMQYDYERSYENSYIRNIETKFTLNITLAAYVKPEEALDLGDITKRILNAVNSEPNRIDYFQKAKDLHACVAAYSAFLMNIRNLIASGKSETAIKDIDMVQSNNGLTLGWRPELGMHLDIRR